MDLTLFVDHQCNLRCRYCYTGRKFTRRMPARVMERAVDLALEQRPPHLDLSFFGGEPLLHLDLLKRTAEYVEQRIAELDERRPTLRYLVNTNLTLLDDAALDWLSPPRRVTVFTSLDGPAAIHDRNRRDADGQGSHARVHRAMHRLEERKIPYQVVAVFGLESAARLGEVVHELFSTQATRLQLAPNFHDPWRPPDIERLREGLADAGQAWMERFRSGTALQLDPMHTKILTHLHGGIPCPSRCRFAGREWAVAPSGRIYACAQMVGEDTRDELVIGDIETGFDAARVAELQARKDRVETTCAECALRDRCQSHCGCRHLALSGELGRINAVLCETEHALVEAADRVAEELFSERCPTFVDYYYRRTWKAAGGSQLTQLRRSRDA